MARNCWKWLEIAWHGGKWLEFAGNDNDDDNSDDNVDDNENDNDNNNDNEKDNDDNDFRTTI